MQLITLITDYGTRDQYVGALKGVILSIARSASIVDVTHDIEPYNVLHAAFVLRQIWPWYPRGTVHLAVVDPGVGSDRRIILGQYGGQFVIAPDNGLVTLVHREMQAEAVYVVEDRRHFLPHPSTTFHGRDIMAPVAARLANGVKPQKFGRATDHLEVLPVDHRAQIDGDMVRGTVLYVDRFGTLVTNIGDDQLPRGERRVAPEVVVNDENIGPLRSTFPDVAPGEPVALIGSSGMVEIAVNQGSAAERFGPVPAVRVEVR
jgi:S-adenosylmethionine hydrolase